jgi:hypothetical protein
VNIKLLPKAHRRSIHTRFLLWLKNNRNDQ